MSAATDASGQYHNHPNYFKAKAPKVDRKEYHSKLYKNPPELVLAIVQAAEKKVARNWFRVVLLATMAGSTFGTPTRR